MPPFRAFPARGQGAPAKTCVLGLTRAPRSSKKGARAGSPFLQRRAPGAPLQFLKLDRNENKMQDENEASESELVELESIYEAMLRRQIKAGDRGVRLTQKEQMTSTLAGFGLFVVEHIAQDAGKTPALGALATWAAGCGFFDGLKLTPEVVAYSRKLKT